MVTNDDDDDDFVCLCFRFVCLFADEKLQFSQMGELAPNDCKIPD